MGDDGYREEAGSVEEQIAAHEARRAERAADAKRKRDAQKLLDLEVLEKFELELGPEAIGVVEAERHIEGFPVLVIVKMPSKVLMKRHGARLRFDEENTLDLQSAEAANDELGGAVVIYPEADVLKAFDEKLPGIRAAAGGKAASMRGAKIERKGKG